MHLVRARAHLTCNFLLQAMRSSALTLWRSAVRGVNGRAVRGISTVDAIARERGYAATTYHPLPVVWESAKGCEVTDVEGKKARSARGYCLLC